MAAKQTLDLSRRERQIMDVLFRRGKSTVAEVLDELADPPSYSAVRTLLGVLETKGHVRHAKDGRRFVYAPKVPRERARSLAVSNLLRTFFDDSVPSAVASLLDARERDLSEEELARIEELVAKARKGGGR